MLRKWVLSLVLIVVVAALSGLLTGCGDDIKTHEHIEVHDQVIKQEEVVE